jgi:hypothetical protein
MRKILLTLLSLFVLTVPSFAVFSTSTVWQWDEDGSSNYGGGFDPTLGGIDYSVGYSTPTKFTDIVIGNSSMTITSAARPFVATDAGNYIVIWGTNQARCEILSVDGSNVATLDQSAGTALLEGCTAYLGGSLNYVTDAILESVVEGNVIYVKGNVNTGGNINVIYGIGVTSCTIEVIGYDTDRVSTNVCSGVSRPTVSEGSYNLNFGRYCNVKNVRFTGTGTPVFGTNGYSICQNCHFENTSLIAGRNAYQRPTASNSQVINCTFSNPTGYGFVDSGGTSYLNSVILNCTFYDCLTAIGITNGNPVIEFNTIYNSTIAISFVGASVRLGSISNNTIYNSSIAINLNGATNVCIKNNIISNVQVDLYNNGVTNFETYIDYNDFWNVGTHTANLLYGSHNLFVDPQFTDVALGDFSIGTNLANKGFPYNIDIGAWQRVAGTAAGGQKFSITVQ